MNRRIAALAGAGLLAVGAATLAVPASARDSFSLSIGAPGVAFGYSNYPYYTPYYYAPAPAPYTYYYGPSVVYRPYYRPYYHHYYYRHHDWDDYGHHYYRR
jgi:hypothetical protein